MRALGRLLTLLLVGVPALLLAGRVWDSLRWDELAAVLSGRIERALPSTAYQAVDDHWLEFKLSGRGRALRVRSNAVIDAEPVQAPDAEWWYAFDYQLLDGSGGLLREGVYHHRTRSTPFRDPDSDRLVSRNFLLDPALAPSDGRSMLLGLDAAQSPVALRIRPRHRDPQLRALMFRVYEQLPNPEHQLGYLWQRLPESKKVRLADSSVYGLDLLREQERQNLLRYSWQAVGPLGVEDEHYRSVKLYITRELEAERVEEAQLPHGLYCSPGLRGIIPLPEGDWTVTLQVIPLDPGAAGAGDIRVRWYGRGITERRQTRLPAAGGRYTLDGVFAGGLLEIIAPRPLVVRAWGGSGGERRDLTPEPLRLRAFLVDADGGLSVDIDHVAGKATPFRVDLRSRLQPGEQHVRRRLDYALLDRHGETLRSGHLTVDLARSVYDRMDGDEPEAGLSEPTRYYFDLPPAVAAVRLSSADGLLLSTYSRPPDLVRRVRVPEDYLDNGGDLSRQPAWFLLQPAEEQRLRREQRTAMLTLQPRPPETDPRLLAGDYDWTLYQPLGQWRARHLLVPRRDELPVRDLSLDAVYREVDGDTPLRLRFRTLPGRRAADPRLLYLRKRSAPLGVSVMLGRRVHSETEIAGRQGELQLPAVRPGEARLTISAAEPVRWFINQAEAPGASYLRRLAMQLGADGLSFDYDKQTADAEVLSGEIYLPLAERAGLRVSIRGDASNGPGPRREWTFRERLYDLKPQSGEPIPVLNSAQPPLFGGQRFFLPLGADLPPGRYRIRFALEGVQQGYLTLYRLSAGQSELRAFFREDTNVEKTGI